MMMQACSHRGLVLMFADERMAKENYSPRPAITFEWFLKMAIRPSSGFCS